MMVEYPNFKPQNIIVIGGEGFLGSNLIYGLIKAYPSSNVHSLDLVQRNFDYNCFDPNRQEEGEDPRICHRFVRADLTSTESISESFESIRPDLVFHTASPRIGSGREICEKVNVQGTINVLEACLRVGVQRLVYTSSAGVVYNGVDLINVDERLPYPKVSIDDYNLSKAKAETLILEANGKGSLLTCALRPAGIFGPGDSQAIPSMIQVIKNGQHRIQLGPNNNLFDWTYVDNVVRSHLLAAQRLDQSVPLSQFATSLPPIWKTNPRRVVTASSSVKSDSEDVSSISNNTDDGELINMSTISLDFSPRVRSNNSSSVTSESTMAIDPPLLARRHRWDQWSQVSTEINYPDQFVKVAGQAFFITGGEPIFFWDFARSVWTNYVKQSKLAKRLGLDPNPRFKLVFPAFLAIILAYVVDFWSRLTGRPNAFKPSAVRYACASRYYNIEKARVVLSYEPIVGVEEGIKRSIEASLMLFILVLVDFLDA
ncbi:3-beta hydroxysteroid dehydrogenase/isomerase family-domain-containing protein [Phakopsora pachyrhizi]|uniref:3-beta hydroxysteroid dehydrogenase/isomerase family-domain-containing protein n=1 Tax=Phakopsora pachyrhizi TaxID=170000 RepID=A0AAV0BJW5_PHAPC|nr:3-beta hydroxysteroid dehydrogenase/isomerase family-domain-containing protein [Phakopsora pachyrhizi]